MPASFKPNTDPWIVAHRGGLRDAPENTRAAFDNALAHDVDGIELDVQLTRDGVIVLYHDGDLRKIASDRRRVSDHTYDELDRFDWGRWHGEEFNAEPLMTLEQVLKLYAPRTRVMIEIKSFKHDRRGGRSAELTRRVIEALHRHVVPGRAENIFVLSFDPDVLTLAWDNDRDRHYVLNSFNPRSRMKKDSVDPDCLYAYGAPIARITRAFVEFAHERHKYVMTWACNTARQVRKALEAGVDVIMTDRPAWTVACLKSLRADR